MKDRLEQQGDQEPQDLLAHPEQPDQLALPEHPVLSALLEQRVEADPEA